MNTCLVENCNSNSVCRGWCGMHYARWKRNGDPALVLGGRWADHEKILNTCSVSGCGRKQYKTKMCTMHKQRVHRYANPLTVKPRGGRSYVSKGWAERREAISVEIAPILPPTEWTNEMRGAYIACALDTDGWVTMSGSSHTDGHPRLAGKAGVTNQSLELLERISLLADVPFRPTLNGKPGTDNRSIRTTTECWQCVWSSAPDVIKLLSLALPYLVAKQERGALVLEYALSRIAPSGKVAHRGQPYTERDWEIAALVRKANGRFPNESTTAIIKT